MQKLQGATLTEVWNYWEENKNSSNLLSSIFFGVKLYSYKVQLFVGILAVMLQKSTQIP